MLRTVCKRTIFTLNAFVSTNPSNQEILATETPLLRSKMGLGLNVWDVVVSMYEGNQTLCEAVPEGLFGDFARRLLSPGVDNLRELDFFYAVIEPRRGFRPVKRSQNLTITYLLGNVTGSENENENEIGNGNGNNDNDLSPLEQVLLLNLPPPAALIETPADERVRALRRNFHVKVSERRERAEQ
tara:strand:- start:677 stop:1231 length:555 start_codon:yes stop_codon:yes gene_type:complete